MSDLEVFRLSAKACGYKLVYPGDTMLPLCVESSKGAGIWNPFTNAEQRWECVRNLLENEGTLSLDGDFNAHEWYRGQLASLVTVTEQCTAEEFPARALAELESRKGKS